MTILNLPSASFVDETVRILKTPLVKDVVLDDEDLYFMDAEESGYQSVFVRLHSISKAAFDPAPEVQNSEEYFKTKLSKSAFGKIPNRSLS